MNKRGGGTEHGEGEISLHGKDGEKKLIKIEKGWDAEGERERKEEGRWEEKEGANEEGEEKIVFLINTPAGSQWSPPSRRPGTSLHASLRPILLSFAFFFIKTTPLPSTRIL